ncbi:MAG: CPBP family intramembrane glutamic endopeptidase [Halobacteriales archaeon]|nr:CPBP family intramembrane glutamic endopeptidase [Halobacteriales archaeon]
MDQEPHRRGLTLDLSDRREISGYLLVTVVGIEIVLSTVINLVVFPNAWVESTVFAPIQAATAGLVTASMLVNLVSIAVVPVGLLVIVSGLRWRDLGLDRTQLPVAVAVTAGIWIVAQCIGAGIAFFDTGTVTLDPTWIDSGVGGTLGLVLTQLIGNALYEEVVFRAVLFDQLVLKFRDRASGFEYALIGSQLVFALLHVPNRLYRGYSLPEFGESLALLFLLGLMFAIVYHRTGNLLIAVGMHALINAPTMVIETAVSGQLLVIGLLTVLILVWPRLRRSITAARTRTPIEE